MGRFWKSSLPGIPLFNQKPMLAICCCSTLLSNKVKRNIHKIVPTSTAYWRDSVTTENAAADLRKKTSLTVRIQ
jgi:hypothetical protein